MTIGEHDSLPPLASALMVTQEEPDALKRAFLRRAMAAIRALAEVARPDSLEQAVSAPSDMLAVLTAMAAPEAAGLASDVLATARARGIVRRDELLASEGGVLGTNDVAALLRMSPQGVNKRRDEGKLLFVLAGGRYLYPAWQFTDSETWPGLEAIIAALGDAPDLAKVRFFLAGSHRLGGQRPLDILRSRRPLEPVLKAARAFDEHGAA